MEIAPLNIGKKGKIHNMLLFIFTHSLSTTMSYTMFLLLRLKSGADMGLRQKVYKNVGLLHFKIVFIYLIKIIYLI